VLLAAGGLWIARRELGGWEVARLEGSPRVGAGRIAKSARLKVGEWLETDASSRARINVGSIGEVEVEPNTRIGLVAARMREHRLALARGSMSARIWAPPRLFFVETPSAVAVDLGCHYTLSVDEGGAGVLRVVSGWVAFERDGRESIVPAGAECVTRPGRGPGTPYFSDASPAFRAALLELDLARGGAETLRTVLGEARVKDGLTLWHLLPRVPPIERGSVYDRLAELVPPPDGVSRQGIERLEQPMIDRWKSRLDLP
jgi:hypothetical protein